jgi:Family of unknown function (DUF6459)
MTTAGLVMAVELAPTLDPPYDDAVSTPTGMDLLPIDWSPVPGAEPRRVPGARPGASRPVASGPPPKPGVMPARVAMQRYVKMCIEVLNGYRPSAHLRPITDQQRFGDVTDQLVRRAVRVRIAPGQAARQGKLVRVRRMLMDEPIDGVAEAAVVLEQGQSCWAMAVRLERGTPGDRANGSWRCTVVQVI